MRAKCLMVLGAGILQVSVIKKARELGIYCLAVDGDPNAVGFTFADKFIVANITDPEKMLEIARNEMVDGIIHPCSEVAMRSLGYVNDVLGLNGIGTETVIRATNKEMMRRAFENGGAPTPKSIAVSNEKAVLEAFLLINGDAIVKPSRNSGSRGVSFVPQNANESQIFFAYSRALSESRDASVVIEEFIVGPEFSVEILIWNNQIKVLTVTDKLTTNEPYFVELGHSQPSQFSDKDVQLIIEAAIAGVKSLNLKQCVAHAELKLSDNGPFLMEIGARLGGDFISTELVHLSTGIDMVACAINIALGLEPDLNFKSKPQGAAIRYFVPSPGIVKEIVGYYNALENENVYDCKIYVEAGDIVKPLKSSLDRCGHIITVGENVCKAVELADKMKTKIKILT